MDSAFNCSTGSIEIRDYTLIEALGKISRERNESLQFAVWEFRREPDKYVIFQPGKEPWKEFNSPQEALNQAPKERIFRRYDDIKILSSLPTPANLGKPFDSSSVLIPINFRFLEQQTALSLTLENGIITLKDAQNRKVGSLSLDNGTVQLIPEPDSSASASVKKQPFEGELIISQTGRLVLQPKEDKEKHLFLGQGFRSYEMDLNSWSPVEQQAPLHLCAANAAVSLIEHFECRADGRRLDASRLFLHQAACHLLNLPPTAACSVRAVVAALTTFGVALESSWPYDIDKLEVEPPAWCYSQARNYKANSYLRLDRPGMDKDALIAQIKLFVYSGIPPIFGFSIHEGAEQAGPMPTSGQSWQANQQIQTLQDLQLNAEALRHLSKIEQALGIQKQVGNYPEQLFGVPGHIPFPTFSELYCGGHAAVVVGYDDKKIIANCKPLTRHDRSRLNLSKVRVFLLTEGGQWQEYEWKEDKKEYCRVTNAPLDFEQFGFMEHDDFNGLFILLVKRPFDIHKTSQTDSQPLVPRDVLFESNDTVGRNEIMVDEYLATKGAFKIRNSWGKAWGEKGYGWLPYAYIYQDLTFDWWSVLKFEWMNTDSFGLLRTENDLVMCDEDCGEGGQ